MRATKILQTSSYKKMKSVGFLCFLEEVEYSKRQIPCLGCKEIQVTREIKNGIL